MLNTASSYRLITSDLTRSLTNLAKKPQVARETEYYLAHIGMVKSIDEFLADRRLFTYAMKAFGLSDLAYAKGLMKKVLSEGVDERGSFANRLADGRYREFAETFNFVRYGQATTSIERTRQGTVDRYLRQTLEEDAGAGNEGVRLALYFERKAPGLRSAYSILADPALIKVAQTALGLPPAMAGADIERQAEAISKRLDIAGLKEPAKLQRFLQRFMAMWDLSAAALHPPAVIVSHRPQAGIPSTLLAVLQKLRFGGA